MNCHKVKMPKAAKVCFHLAALGILIYYGES